LGRRAIESDVPIGGEPSFTVVMKWKMLRQTASFLGIMMTLGKGRMKETLLTRGTRTGRVLKS
jgi:hypothetical protein